MGIKASEILAMMKRLGFRVTGYGRGAYRCKDGDFIVVFTRGTKKVRGIKNERHKLVSRLDGKLFMPFRGYIEKYRSENGRYWKRVCASADRRSYAYLRAQFYFSTGDVPGERYMRLAIDNGKVWDKPAKCPVLLYAGASEHYNELSAWPLPELESRLRKVCGKLATKDGYNASNTYDYDTFMLVNNG